MAHRKETEMKKIQRYRAAYKKLELFAAYFDPATATALSGWNSITLNDTAAMRRETIQVVSHIEQLKKATDSLVSTDAQLFDAMTIEMEKVKDFEANENGVADTERSISRSEGNLVILPG